MTASPPTADDEALPRIDGPGAWTEALRWALPRCARAPVRRIVCIDPDFDGWPLDDPGALRAFTDWLRLPQRQWVLLASSYAAVPRRQPRFTAWRAPWVHALHTLQVPAECRADLPSVLLDDQGLCLWLSDRERGRGGALRDRRAAHPWLERAGDLMARAEPAFPVTPLGL